MNIDTETKPHVAIIEPNTLAVVGLSNILQSVMPVMQIDSFSCFEELVSSVPDRYFHYFVNVNIVLEHISFFQQYKHKTIVLSHVSDSLVLSEKFHNICVVAPEKQLVRSLLMLEQNAHAGGRNMPVMHNTGRENVVLSARETEVTALIVKGLINKEIADKLNISLSTVITHRKNIMAKLGIKSVSALTIYAVMHGYVDLHDI